MEVWLKPNRRALLMGVIPLALVAGLGVLLVARFETLFPWLTGLVLLGMAAGATIGLVRQLRHARIAFSEGEVLFNLRAGPPIAVPVSVVEAFFLGQGPAHLPTVQGKEPETVNLVARLSQKAPEWAHVDVKPALGHWCESYVTIRGTWCEPLTGDVIRRLNHRLRELHTATDAGGAAVASDAAPPASSEAAT